MVGCNSGKRIKKVLTVCGFILLLFVFIGSSFAQENVRIFVNSKEITTDVPPQIIQNRTMVPARFIAEALGAKVDWDDANKTVLITTQEKKQPYRFLKLDGDQTPWLYWEEDNKLYVEVHNVTEMFKEKYPMAHVGLSFSEDLVTIDNRVINLPVKTFDGFKAVSLDYIFYKTGMLNFEWDSANGNLILK